MGHKLEGWLIPSGLAERGVWVEKTASRSSCRGLTMDVGDVGRPPEHRPAVLGGHSESER